MGEVAPTYFAPREAPRRIKELVPNAKIVCIFRHPVERILSLYRVKRAYGIIPWSFEEAILRVPELTETSKYATYLKSWQHEFGVDRGVKKEVSAKYSCCFHLSLRKYV